VIVNGPINLATVGRDLAAPTAIGSRPEPAGKSSVYAASCNAERRNTTTRRTSQNVGATTVYEQPNMTVGTGANRLRTSKACGAMIWLR
jgi:hypothetical protein